MTSDTRDVLEHRLARPGVPRLALLEQMLLLYVGGHALLERSGVVLVDGCRFNPGFRG